MHFLKHNPNAGGPGFKARASSVARIKLGLGDGSGLVSRGGGGAAPQGWISYINIRNAFGVWAGPSAS